MGSRLSIDFTEFTSNQYTEVWVTTKIHAPVAGEGEVGGAEHIALVTFIGKERSPEYHFELESFQGKVTLTRDFDYFRYEDDSEAKALLRWLYHAGVCFSVTH